MHVEFGPYHVRDIQFVAAFDVDAKKVGRDLSEAISASREQHHQDLRRAAAERRRPARPHPRRARQVLPRDHRGVRRGARRRRHDAARGRGRRAGLATCPSARSTPPSSTPSAPSTPASPSSTPCRCSSPAHPSGRPSSSEAGVPIVGDDIKSPGRRDHHPPRAGQAVRGPRRRACTARCSSTSAATWTS